MDDYEEKEPLAAWESRIPPLWTWEAFEKVDDSRYYGRVASPLTYGDWEWGYFTEEELKEVDAYRTDVKEGELFPDGGHVEDPAQTKLYETGPETRDFGQASLETAATEGRAEQVNSSAFSSDQSTLSDSGEG